MILTYKLAMAAGQDAANRQMRKAGRKSWRRADYDLACRVTAKLLNENSHDLRRSKEHCL